MDLATGQPDPRDRGNTGPGDGPVDTGCGRVLDIEKAGESPNGSFCDDCLHKLGSKVDDSRRRQ